LNKLEYKDDNIRMSGGQKTSEIVDEAEYMA
jgi:hypothetical protein